jgi:HEAT repeat protein
MTSPDRLRSAGAGEATPGVSGGGGVSHGQPGRRSTSAPATRDSDKCDKQSGAHASRDPDVRRSTLLAVVVSLALVVPAFAQVPDFTGSRYVRATLGEEVSGATSICAVRVESVDPKDGSITFRRTRKLKGQVGWKTVQLHLPRFLSDRERAQLLAWAEPEKRAVIFLRERGWRVCVGNSWYEAQQMQSGEWAAVAELPAARTAYVGPAERLGQHVADILRGREVTITAAVPEDLSGFGKPPCPAPLDWVRGKKGTVWRIKASLAIDDVNEVDGEESRHFVGWGVGGSEVMPTLLAALKDEDARVRAGAAEDLGRLPEADRAVRDSLSAALGDPDPFVRVFAAEALVRVQADTPAAVAVLCEALGQEEAAVRTAACAALAEAGRPAAGALRALTRALARDPDAVVRATAAYAIGQLGPEGRLSAGGRVKAVAALGAALRGDDDPDVRLSAGRALLGFGAAARAAIPDLTVALGEQTEIAVEVLARLGPDGLPPLIAELGKPDSGSRWLVAHRLGLMGPAAATAAPALHDLLGDEDPGIRLTAAEALARVDPSRGAEAAAVYARALRDEVKPGPRWRLLSRLEELGPTAATALPELTAALRGENVQERRRAASALGEVGEKRAAEVLSTALGDPDPWVRITAAKGLLRTGWRREALAGLARELDRDDDHVREVAATALGEVGPGAAFALPRLRARLRDPSPSCRVAAAVATWRLEQRVESEEVVHDARLVGLRVLIDLLGSPDASSRGLAASGLEEIGTGARPAVPALLKALRDVKPGVRSRAAAALGRIGPEMEATDALTEALVDDVGYVRLAAAGALARLGTASPPAVAVLVRHLEKRPWDAPDVIDALAEFGPNAAAAVPVLLRCLAEEDLSVYLAAARALSRIDPEAARKAGLP